MVTSPQKSALPSNPADLFDRQIRIIKKQRYAGQFNNFDFIHGAVANALADRLLDITRAYNSATIIGDRADILKTSIEKTGKVKTIYALCTDTNPVAEISNEMLSDHLGLEENSQDLIISFLDLHAVGDVPGSLAQISHALKPDGLFLAAFFGGESLYELRASLLAAEEKITGGVSPRIMPFADKKSAGALMQRCGFNLPVVDSDIIKISYEHIFKIIEDLRGMGETNILRSRPKTIPPRNLFFEAQNFYKDNFTGPDGRLEATCEVIYLAGWKPHESQQKPMRPGSAQNRLADALNTDEIGTGEKPHEN